MLDPTGGQVPANMEAGSGIVTVLVESLFFMPQGAGLQTRTMQIFPAEWGTCCGFRLPEFAIRPPGRQNLRVVFLRVRGMRQFLLNWP